MPFSLRFFILSICLIASLSVSFQIIALPISAKELAIECPIPQFHRNIKTSPTKYSDGITITSQKSMIEKDQFALFSGGVTLINQEQRILANQLEINRNNATIDASGDIHFQNSSVDIFAQHLNANEITKETTLDQTAYQLFDSSAHGEATKISVNLDGTLSLKDSSFTTCYGEIPDWQLQASEIKISLKDNLGEAYHARIKLFDVPVLYIPYFTFPVTNERKSGFLYPKIGSSTRTGLDIEVPFYWNIAPNMDATITPRIMSRRGVQLLTEFRYLSGFQSGSINIEYLNKDNALENNDDPRYLVRFQHTGTFSDRFRAYVDYSTMSDDNYLIDINSKQYNANDSYLYQIGELAYFGDSWQAALQYQDLEVLGDHNPTYKTVPQLQISSQQTLPFWNAQFELYSELSRFKATAEDLPDAQRSHIEAGITFPIATPAWFLNSEFKLLQTNYKQENIATDSLLEESVNRTLPKIRFHGGINFDRPSNIFGKGMTQTFEPQLQYLFIPNKNQSNIGVYDTTPLQDDYSGLFRDRRFSGLDRIAQANQISWGVTSRVLTSSNQELFRMSLGKIVYLNNSNDLNQHLSTASVDNIEVNESALAADVFFQIDQRWQLSGDIQYDSKDQLTNKSQVSLDYNYTKNNTVQLNHRYTRNVSGTSLEQLSLLSSATLNKNWQFVGRLSHDLQQKRSLESYIGLQYESCCWAVRLAYHRHINSNLDQENILNENRDEFDSGFMIQFVLKGLSGRQTSISTEDMFNSSIFGYKRPYFLNN